ncbi:MAG: hypothetical protein LLG40_06880 [Deltaproteobacteria bacterium]|nr:hypothetical protein [Deltaproteobacteria bacterium]
MHYLKSKNILINIVLCLCAVAFALGVTEYALRRVVVEGLSGEKIWIVKSMDDDETNYFLSKALVAACKDFTFSVGNCYTSDPTERLPFKIINPDDGKQWYCVPYNVMQRHQGYHPERKRQIVLVGDSFVFGQGVKESDTLGYLLNEKYPEINFQNWGENGANIDTVAQKCKDIIKSEQAIDEVVYFYNLNDVRMSETVNIKLRNIVNDFQNVRWINDEEPYGIIVKPLSKSALFSLIRKTWVIKRESSLTAQTYKDMYLSEYNRQEFLSTMDCIQSIKDMLAARGISFRMIIYPLMYKDLTGSYPFARVHAEIISECNKRGIPCLDGYVPFKNYYSLKKFAVHPLDYHPNGLSNREIVDYIHETNFITKRQES